MNSLTHVTILTGASRGLGLAIAQQVLARGGRLLTLQRHPNAALAAPVGQLEQWVCDLTAPEAPAVRLAAWVQALPRQQLASLTLINNAAGMTRVAPLGGIDPSALAAALRLGLEAPTALTAAFLGATERGPLRPTLVTSFAEGRPYAEDLRALAAGGEPAPLDLARARVLATWLSRIHRLHLEDPVAWRRAARDLVGSGEGIFGLVDAYPADTPGAPAARLRRLEEGALSWRWRLRGRSDRLRRIHGDFHPFNVIFSQGTHFTALDASRGAVGDPADDLTALTVNYPFFALQAPGSWARAFAPLWRVAWGTYLTAAGDGVLDAAPPFLAWRALVLGCPRFYPDLPAAAREALLAWAERLLGRPRFDPDHVEGLFP